MSEESRALEVVRPAGERVPNVFMPVMTLEVALDRRTAIVEFTKRIMVADLDFGVIPGTNKPTLLKPGAEKLCCFFGLEPEFSVTETAQDWTGREHDGEMFFYVAYKCRLLKNGQVLGVGEGSCNSWESKYRYRWVREEDVPLRFNLNDLPERPGTIVEFAFAIDKAETSGKYGKPAEYWARWKEAIQAGEARQIQKKLSKGGERPAWEMGGTLYRVPNPDIADVVNTIQKMAQKRALVAATLIATSASEFYTQDVEDTADIDTGGHPVGTKEAAEHVGKEKLKQAQPDIAIPGPLAGIVATLDKAADKSGAKTQALELLLGKMREASPEHGEAEYDRIIDKHNLKVPQSRRTFILAISEMWEVIEMALEAQRPKDAFKAGDDALPTDLFNQPEHATS